MNDVTLDIYIISRLTHAYYARELAKLGITMAQFPFIMGIIENDGISQDKLAKQLRMGKSTTTAVIKQLEEKKLIVREVDAADRRSFRLHAADSAHALKKEIEAVVEQCNMLITSDLDGNSCGEFCNLLAEVRCCTEKKIGSSGN